MLRQGENGKGHWWNWTHWDIHSCVCQSKNTSTKLNRKSIRSAGSLGSIRARDQLPRTRLKKKIKERTRLRAGSIFSPPGMPFPNWSRWNLWKRGRQPSEQNSWHMTWQMPVISSFLRNIFLNKELYSEFQEVNFQRSSPCGRSWEKKSFGKNLTVSQHTFALNMNIGSKSSRRGFLNVPREERRKVRQKRGIRHSKEGPWVYIAGWTAISGGKMGRLVEKGEKKPSVGYLEVRGDGRTLLFWSQKKRERASGWIQDLC